MARSNQGHTMTMHSYNSQLISLPSVNFLVRTVSTIKPGQDFIGQGHYGKVKSRTHHDGEHLQLQLISLPSVNFPLQTVSGYSKDKIFKIKVTLTRSNQGHTRCDVAHIYPLTNMPTKYQFSTPYGSCDTGQTNILTPPAHLDTMGENNIPTALIRAVG